MTDERARRVARNEAMSRFVNEAIEEVNALDDEGRRAYFCECTQADCGIRLTLSQDDYERIRAHPRRFAVAVAHVDTTIEIVVEESTGYVIVEKHGEAGRVAESRDPRS
jgi:hypothetical protein